VAKNTPGQFVRRFPGASRKILPSSDLLYGGNISIFKNPCPGGFSKGCPSGRSGVLLFCSSLNIIVYFLPLRLIVGSSSSVRFAHIVINLFVYVLPFVAYTLSSSTAKDTILNPPSFRPYDSSVMTPLLILLLFFSPDP
jgi:hypothetical protein